MLSNGKVQELIRDHVITVSGAEVDVEIGDWGLLLHLDMIGFYPKRPQDAQVGRMDGYYPVVFGDAVRYAEVLPQESYLVTLREEVTIPPEFAAEIRLRPEFASCGGLLLTAPVLCNNTQQRMHVILRNLAPEKFLVTPHLALAELVISRVEGETIIHTPQQITPSPEVEHEPPPWVRDLQEQAERERLAAQHPPLTDCEIQGRDAQPFADPEWPF